MKPERYARLAQLADTAIEKLAELLQSDDEIIRLQAAEIILEIARAAGVFEWRKSMAVFPADCADVDPEVAN